MQLSEVVLRSVPDSISVHGAEDMRAEATTYKEHSWCALGGVRDGKFSSLITIHFRGPDAAAKSKRLAAAINAVMAEQPQEQDR